MILACDLIRGKTRHENWTDELRRSSLRSCGRHRDAAYLASHPESVYDSQVQVFMKKLWEGEWSWKMVRITIVGEVISTVKEMELWCPQVSGATTLGSTFTLKSWLVVFGA